MKIHDRLKAWARGIAKSDAPKAVRFAPPVMPAGVAPERLAMDAACASAYDYMNSCGIGESFPGYPLLTELTQYAEYRMLSEKTAEAMCRKWIEFTTKGDGDKSEKIAQIESEFERIKARSLFQKSAELDSYFGRCQLFIDVGLVEGPELASPLILDAAKIGKGSLRKLTLVEPVTTYPAAYNSLNPLADDYYKPSMWYIMSQQVHASRLLTFVARPVPNMLKPAYNFGGVSMSQLARPYVENWTKTRASVGRLISNFSTTAIKTNMGVALSGGDGNDIIERGELFNAMRDNQGLMMLDKGSMAEPGEELVQLNVPLSGLDKLQAQSQEHMSSVSSTPLSILLGITPTGLNASNDGEIRTFYDYILGQQEKVFTDNLHRLLAVVQLSLFGVIDPDIGFKYVPLWQQSEAEAAANRKSDAETASIYQEMGVVDAGEVRGRLASDPDSGYTGLVGVIEAPTPDDDEGALDGDA